MSTHPMQSQEPTWRGGVRPLSNPELGKAGPFYCATVSVPCGFSQSDWVRAFHEQDGATKLANRIEPGIFYCVKKDEILVDIDIANGAGKGAYVRDVQGTEERVTPVETSPADNRRFLMQTHGDSGLVFIDAFEGLDERIVRIGLLSSLLRPVTFTPEYQEENPEIAEKIARLGALAVYRQVMEEGFAFIGSREFLNRYDVTLQKLYLSAKPSVMEMYRKADVYVKNQCRESNARVRTGASKGAHHDVLADYAFYLSGLQPEDTALQRALQPQEVVVKMEGQASADIDRKACPRCAERIAVEATFCRFCQLDLTVGAGAEKQTRIKDLQTKSKIQLTDEP